MSNYYSNYCLELRDLSTPEVAWLTDSYAALQKLTELMDTNPEKGSADWLRAKSLWDANLINQEVSFEAFEDEVPTLPIVDFEGNTVALWGDSECINIDVACSWLAKFLSHRVDGWTTPPELFLEWANWCDREEVEGFSGGVAIITKDGYSCTYTGADQVKNLLREIHARGPGKNGDPA